MKSPQPLEPPPSQSKRHISGFNWLLFALLIIGQIISVGLIGMSCYPGALYEGILLLLIVVYVLGVPLAIAAILLIGIMVLLWKRERRNPPDIVLKHRRDRRRLVMISLATIVITSVLVTTNLPRFIAFSLSRPAFESVINDSNQLKDVCNSRPVDVQLGIYTVLVCDRDARGGIYFNTGEHGFLFNSAYYGFVYQPNPYGSQLFGSDVYKYEAITGDWYWFQASKDF